MQDLISKKLLTISNRPLNSDELTVKAFEGFEPRQAEYNGKIFYSVVDFIDFLIKDSDIKQESNIYWGNLKRDNKGNQAFNQPMGNSHKLKFLASDGKMRIMDGMQTETLLELIDVLPFKSEKKDLIKQWLRKLGAERIEEIKNPELGIKRSIQRAKQIYDKRGKDLGWQKNRIEGISDRIHCIDVLIERNTDPLALPILTNQINLVALNKTAKQKREELGLVKNVSLRDNLTSDELLILSKTESASVQVIEQRNVFGVYDCGKAIQSTKPAIDALKAALEQIALLK